jgi:hypothetical protein
VVGLGWMGFITDEDEDEDEDEKEGIARRI